MDDWGRIADDDCALCGHSSIQDSDQMSAPADFGYLLLGFQVSIGFGGCSARVVGAQRIGQCRVGQRNMYNIFANLYISICERFVYAADEYSSLACIRCEANWKNTTTHMMLFICSSRRCDLPLSKITSQPITVNFVSIINRFVSRTPQLHQKHTFLKIRAERRTAAYKIWIAKNEIKSKVEIGLFVVIR